jgi:alanine-glyoxylate transaminase/serine-glyoxylate transaminase/serine-pyruvate transaminase
MLAGTLCGVEMGLRLAGVPHTDGGVMAALDSLGVPTGKAEAVLS